MAKYNYKWASDVVDGKPVYAPADKLVVHGKTVLNPKDVHYRIAGFLPVVDEAPAVPAPDGYHWEPRYWRAETIRVARVYEAVQDPPPPANKYSKLKLYAALVNAGLWDAFEGWLRGQTIEGVNGYTAFSLAQDLSDDHPLFMPLYSAAKTAIGVSDEEAERILDAAREA